VKQIEVKGKKRPDGEDKQIVDVKADLAQDYARKLMRSASRDDHAECKGRKKCIVQQKRQ